MISYKPFYETLFRRNFTEYQLIHHHGVSANTLHRIKKGEAITTKTIDTLCDILNCEVQDIILHIWGEAAKWGERKKRNTAFTVCFSFLLSYQHISGGSQYYLDDQEADHYLCI